MQSGFFDLDNRLQLLEKLGDPLPKLNRCVTWEDFRPILKRIREQPRKSTAGRKPYDSILMFKILVLQHLYGLADDQTEYQIRDRYSFCHFLSLTPEGRVPDAKTIWVFKEHLKHHDLMDELFARLTQMIDMAGYVSRQGQIIDASIVAAPKQRNSRKDNAKIKIGEVPEDWKDKPSMLRQKDCDARWTQKHGKSHYGYKNHISVDNKHKVIRHFEVTPASVHDSQVFDVLLDDTNTSGDVWADSAYRSKAQEEQLVIDGYRSHINTKGRRGKPVSACQMRANRKRSKVRSRVEHIFGAQKVMGGQVVRSIGLQRARIKIALTNMVYNMRRLVWLNGVKG